MATDKEQLIEEKRAEIRGLKNLLEQGDYKARKLLFEVCSIVKENLDVEMPVFDNYEQAEEQAQQFRDRINELEEEIKELETTTEEETEELRQYIVADSVVKNSKIEDTGDKRFIRIANSFINIDELEIDLIDRINPFQRAFEVLSKDINARKLKSIQDAIEMTRLQLSEEEAQYYYKMAIQFLKTTGRHPNIKSNDYSEQKMAQAILYVKKKYVFLFGSYLSFNSLFIMPLYDGH